MTENINRIEKWKEMTVTIQKYDRYHSEDQMSAVRFAFAFEREEVWKGRPNKHTVTKKG